MFVFERLSPKRPLLLSVLERLPPKFPLPLLLGRVVFVPSVPLPPLRLRR